MQDKLRLDPDELRVDTFVAHDAAPERGTVHGNEEGATAGATCRTFCHTLGCCPNTALC